MLKIRPDDFDVLIAIAKLYTELQEHDKAAQYYRRASNIKQDDGEVFVRLVEAQVRPLVMPTLCVPSESVLVLVSAITILPQGLACAGAQVPPQSLLIKPISMVY